MHSTNAAVSQSLWVIVQLAAAAVSVRQSDWTRRCLCGWQITHIAAFYFFSCVAVTLQGTCLSSSIEPLLLVFLLLKPTLLPLWNLLILTLPCLAPNSVPTFCTVIKHRVSRFKLLRVTQNAVSAIVICQDSTCRLLHEQSVVGERNTTLQLKWL